MKGFLKLLVLLPLAALATVFAVINRDVVMVTFDPLDWTGLGQTLSVPLFLVIFAALAVGVTIAPAGCTTGRPDPRIHEKFRELLLTVFGAIPHNSFIDVDRA